MEIKKAATADIENKRQTHFLLGMVAAVALLTVALEWSMKGDGIPENILTFEETAQEMEEVPAMRNEVTMVASEQKVLPAEKIVVVENAVEELMGGKEHSTIGEMEVPEADVTPVSVAPQVVNQNDDVLSVRVVERLPEFPGGMSGLAKWLTDNLRYPHSARMAKAEGQVVAAFIVNKDGSITDLKVVKDALPALDKEAMRVLRMMPHWKAGEYKGVACRTYVQIPIVFKL